MIVKKLREQKKLFQEQLAIMSGLNVRTIQRIERGNRASIESLKSLASVLETTVSMLEREVVVMDKTSARWKRLPLWFRLNFVGSEFGRLGLATKEHWLKGEKQTAIFGLSLLPFGVFEFGFCVGGLLVLCVAYGLSLITRAGDRYSIW